MNSTVIELYIYMDNSEEIIKWLESEGVKTKEQARTKLSLCKKQHIKCCSYTWKFSIWNFKLCKKSGCSF